MPAIHPQARTTPGDRQEFRVGAAIVDPKEVPDGTTKSTPYPRRDPGPAPGRGRSEDGLRGRWPAGRVEEGPGRAGAQRRDGPPLEGEDAGNTRNGYGRKTVTTETGRIELAIPRDRQATFDPQLIARYQRRFPGFDDKIVSLYARGMSTREIVAHLRELYGIEVSPDLISAVTDAVLEEVAAWQARPLEPVYPIVFFDALRIKVRDEGVVRNKAVHIALGVRADGSKEILGLWLEQNEGAKFWLRVIERAEAPRRRGRAAGRGRRPEGLPRRDPGGVPRGAGPDLHRPPPAPQPRLRLLQGPQARGGSAEGHLPRARCRGWRGGASSLRGG
ncbi:hypothetical protein ABIE45_006185 [Methylobacterium sp. OAE515]